MASSAPVNNPLARVLQVALKMHKVVQDPRDILRTEAGMHVNAWVKLGHVIRPLGYLKAHDQTGTPAMLVLELAMYVKPKLVHVSRNQTLRAANVLQLTHWGESVNTTIIIRVYTLCVRYTFCVPLYVTNSV